MIEKTLLEITQRYTLIICRKPIEVPLLKRGENKSIRQEANLL
jgi:hypothetical protein